MIKIEWKDICLLGFIYLGCWVWICVAVKAKAPDKAPAGSGSSFNQILGIKGAKQETVSH